MAQTEITVQIFEDINNVKNKLKQEGFVENKVLTGNDFYFTTMPKEKVKNATYKELLDTSLIVRFFKINDTTEYTSMLLYKNKILDENQNVIGEEKISTKIENPETMIKMLKLANLENWVALKQQNAFMEKGEKCIIVGTVEGLDGCFMEIEEYESIKNLDENKKFEELKKYVQSFNFKMGNDYSVKKVFMLHNNK